MRKKVKKNDKLSRNTAEKRRKIDQKQLKKKHRTFHKTLTNMGKNAENL